LLKTGDVVGRAYLLIHNVAIQVTVTCGLLEV